MGGINSLAVKEKAEASSNVFKNWQQMSYFITAYNQYYSPDNFFQYAVPVLKEKKNITFSNCMACQDHPNISILGWQHTKQSKSSILSIYIYPQI